MANQITDNRTLINAADVITNWTGTSPTLDTEIFIQGTGSVAENMTNSRRTILYNMTATQNWSNNVFYLWVNCGVVGVLDTKANGGFTVRFTGPTITNYFEFYVGGSDSWPNAIAGGWVQFVVDIEAAPSATGGTPPLTSAIQHVGISGLTTIMTRTADNTWLDAMWRLPDGTPGIIIEGRNGGSTDWNFGNILTQVTTASGTIKSGPGGSYILNTPTQFGINDTSTHGFTDTNKIVFWDSQDFAPSDLYKFSALGNSGGTTNVTWGVKTGTGDDATGAQGVIVAAADTAVRWAMDFDDANVNGANFYGCTFIHGGDFQLDTASISSISTFYIDCSSATISNSEQLRIKVIDANTADGVAFMTTDDLTDIVFSSFEFSDGHAVELTTPRVATQVSKGNIFTGYGSTGTNDAAIYNNTAGAVAISVTDSGTFPITYRNGTSATTTVSASVNVTVTVKNQAGANLAGVEVAIFQDNTARTVLLASTPTNASGQVTTTVAQSLGSIIIRARQSTDTMSFLTSSSTTDGVDDATDTINNPTLHGFQTGDAVVYSQNGGSQNINLTNGTTYYVNASDSPSDTTSVRLYTSAALAIAAGTPIALTAGGAETHQLDPVRYVAASGTATVAASDVAVQITMVTDSIATG